MKIIMSVFILIAAFVITVAAPNLAVNRPNPELAYKAMVMLGSMLMLIGIVSLINNTREQAVASALSIAVRFGGSDEAHHLKWVVDQMVRELTNCRADKESEEYLKLVKEACSGPDGPNTFKWDKGIAP